MREIKRIILHCSDSSWGTASVIEKWHTDPNKPGGPFHSIGYHYVLCSGVLRVGEKYNKDYDGVIQRGREDEVQGAHVKGHNEDSIGICLIGDHTFTYTQLFKTLPKLLSQLMDKYNLTTEDIIGHYELDDKKTCPNIDMDLYRKMIETTRSPRPHPRTGK